MQGQIYSGNKECWQVIETIALVLAHALSWTNNWNDGHNRTLYPTDTDPYEKPSHVEFSGLGSAYINGHGRMSLTGDAPRYRVLENFGNVNITVYARRVSEAQQLDFAGFQIGARSHHYTDATCGANTYYGQLTYDGRISLEKELFHETGADAFYPDRKGPQIFAFPDGVPFNKWIGLRFVVKTVPQGVLLQLYLDKQDNGKWLKVLEFTDDGNWKVSKGHAHCEGFYPSDKVLTEPGFVFLRNDGLGRADYRDFTIKELP